MTETLAPRTESEAGVLPPLMILLMIVTGIVDAVAFLQLGHVFAWSSPAERPRLG